MSFDNVLRIRELRQNCQVRAAAWEKDCQSHAYDFRIAQAFRSQFDQYLYWTQSRTLADVELWHSQRRMTDQDYRFLTDIFKSGRNRSGPLVTKTLRSNHTLRIAIDIDPIDLPDPDDVPTIKPTDKAPVVKAKMIQWRLRQIEIVGRKYGVHRPPETMSFGDYRHFEIYDLPYTPPTPSVAARLEQRIEKLQTSPVSPLTP